MISLSQIARSLPQLSLTDLVSLRASLDEEIEAREAGASGEAAPDGDAAQGGGGPGGPDSTRGYIEIKIIKGRPYAYRRWREGRRLRSKYIGKVKG